MKKVSSLYDHIKVNYEYKLNLYENDIDEIIEDLKDFNIDSVEILKSIFCTRIKREMI